MGWLRRFRGSFAPDHDTFEEEARFPLWQTPFNNAGAMGSTLGIALGVVCRWLPVGSCSALAQP